MNQPPTPPAANDEQQSAVECGEVVHFVEDDGATMHDALIVRVFLHQAALSPTGEASLDLVYIDKSTEAVVHECDVPHYSKLEGRPEGKYWLRTYDEHPESLAG